MSRKKKPQKKTTSKASQPAKKAKATKAPRERVTLPQELYGLATLLLSLLIALSLISFSHGRIGANWLGLVGYGVAFSFQYLFGIGSYLAIGFAGWLGWRKLVGRPVTHLKSKLVYFLALLSSICIVLNTLVELWPQVGQLFDSHIYTEVLHLKRPANLEKIRHNLGGVPYYYLYRDLPTYNLQHMLSTVGTLLVSLALALASFVLVAEISVASLLQKLIARGKRIELSKIRSNRPAPVPAMAIPQPVAHKVATVDPSQIADLPKTEIVLPKQLPPKTTPPPPPQPVHSGGDYKGFELPSASLLSPPKTADTSGLKRLLMQQAQMLEETLGSFGIVAKVGEIHCGPTVIAMEVHPAVGVKVQKIKALESDIALNLEAKSIRIIAPIPGKAAVGIEIPNPMPQEVSFRQMMEEYQQAGLGYKIPILLGKTVTGENVTADLTKTPHMIIAGATGSGKSVCLNSIIMSILHNRRPDEVRLLMVDPKKVELAGYSKVPHMIAPVITEPQEACCALNWLVKEMERRYELLKCVGARNIEGFNGRQPDKAFEESLDIEVPGQLCYMVGIVDELADLMMVSSSDIETPITRIAQMARAVGIHLILATQRPSREVITGLIKANFPTRIACKVSSRINSQIILDEPGAESLLGNGDMLFLPPGASQLVRCQGVYVHDANITKVVKHLCNQSPTDYLIQSFADYESHSSGGGGGGEVDSLYDQALEMVVVTGNASTTFLQRKLKVGYARAASIMDQLESNGVIGPQDGSKPRRILVKRAEMDE
jgi:DNA segregation ATPase FtsK/SpoIIIE, S-DNA-T family